MSASSARVVVVTGGCGFIGLHLVRRLVESGRRVRVLDDLSNGELSALPGGVEVRVGDVSDESFVRLAVGDAEAVFHLAAVASVGRSSAAWLASHRTNANGGVAIMEALRDLAPGAPFVYASSAAVYGQLELAHGQLIGEEMAATPITPYGIDKLASELHARSAGQLFGLRTLGLRFFNVFGPGQSPISPYSGVITRFIARATAGEPMTIYGDGGQTRDFVHVGDAVAAMLAAEDRASSDGPVVNVCTGNPTRIDELARIVATLAGSQAEPVFLPAQPGDIRHSLGDPARARALLDWRPEVDVRSGLAELVGQAAHETGSRA